MAFEFGKCEICGVDVPSMCYRCPKHPVKLDALMQVNPDERVQQAMKEFAERVVKTMECGK